MESLTAELFSNLFMAFGWVLVLTAAGPLLIPCRWHRQFGEWAIPLAIKHMKLFALSAFAPGAFILYGVFYAI